MTESWHQCRKCRGTGWVGGEGRVCVQCGNKGWVTTKLSSYERTLMNIGTVLTGIWTWVKANPTLVGGILTGLGSLLTNKDVKPLMDAATLIMISHGASKASADGAIRAHFAALKKGS